MNGGVVLQEGWYCNEMYTVREFAYVSDTVTSTGGCEAAVTARTRFDGGLGFGIVVW